VLPVDNGQRRVALYAVEAPQNWFEDFGSGQLEGGSATVHLEPTFAQTVNTGTDYHVFLTPKGDSRGLYVTNETPAALKFMSRKAGIPTWPLTIGLWLCAKGTNRFAWQTRRSSGTRCGRMR